MLKRSNRRLLHISPYLSTYFEKNTKTKKKYVPEHERQQHRLLKHVKPLLSKGVTSGQAYSITYV